MHTYSPFVASAECLEPETKRDTVSLVYENLSNFRASKINKRQRTLQAAGNPGTSHNFATEADEATPRKRKRPKCSTADAKQSRPSNNFNSDQRLNSVLEDAAGLEVPSEERKLVSKLDEKELVPYIHFLKKEDTDHGTTNQRRLLADEIECFRTQEAGFTREDTHGIAQPAGNPDYGLGLILHCQYRDGGVTEF
ncbi:uncharacterized protein Z519_04397 [Cladophialophora bantiana CBS 173.52]|uniref:Uncharacterized protein n=1 Tax=Cladophialophora bantiana (strain ATCC 10958 / CBS 173.52 / CDC B-1940 / NIH 8579) TaxID=1442370 RepID=A0A0D2EX16_CLAB1|nr:uncharacterized protein Z519_04397 [Cladophialophora bantiana CBS 173.52]KIW94421.1 hypothetical protein Z519_04397 [Cladophialophora bantiana CBS 173.52]